ncbi:uncharacterized protein LOC132640004 [Lycium barbarum]|uniref:uncharacterized protein LOC132640004 n=1 Tax=Lycium barbarum TaxID=112863 RepID=UPI00293E99AB|nr:uncharacterized protein LOC132640004 [Lycium barbarum]
MDGFIAPFPGIRYHLPEYRGANLLPRNTNELFNQRHASLRNAIQKSFDALKTRFPILKLAPQYAFHTQRYKNRVPLRLEIPLQQQRGMTLSINAKSGESCFLEKSYTPYSQSTFIFFVL